MTDTGMRGRVITVSDRASQGAAEDTSGPLAVRLLAEHGVDAPTPSVVPDEPVLIAAEVRSAVRDRVDVLVLNGGTGLGPRDRTPEAVEPLLERVLPGIGEAVRAASRERVPTTDLSRLLAGTVGTTVVLVLPGSPGAVRDGIQVAGPLLAHAHHLMTGGDHSSTEGPPDAGATTPAAGDVVLSVVTDAVLDEAAHVRAVSGPDAGAVVTFAGRVRDTDHGRGVMSLTYEAHPTAQAVLERVASDIVSREPSVRIAVSHRVGAIPIGEAALVVAVASQHRGEAFRTCSTLVDAVKERLPVWKHQVFADGSDEWVNCP